MVKQRFCALAAVVLAAVVLRTPVAAQGGSWLPAPTGPHQIGVTVYHWVDESRDEIFTDAEDDTRELVVQIWYPADVEDGAQPAAYALFGDADVQGFENLSKIDPFLSGLDFAAIGAAETHGYLDAPISDAESTYPVVIYSPGLPAVPAFVTAQAQELASHGYIVAAINHPYIAGWTVFPDGRIATTLPQSKMERVFQLAEGVGAADQSFVLDMLELLNVDDARFSGRLDLEHVGTFGASWGAWVSSLAALNDARFTAVVCETPHGQLPADVKAEGLDVPIMFMDPLADSSLYGQSLMHGPAYRLKAPGISGFSMGDFLLWPGMWEILSARDRGVVEPQRAAEVVHAYLLAFFDRHLKGEPAPLLDGDSPDYPEVEVKIKDS